MQSAQKVNPPRPTPPASAPRRKHQRDESGPQTKRSLPPRPVSSPPPPPAALSADVVVDYLSKLAAEERDAILTRVRESTEKAEQASVPPPAASEPRPTLSSADLEVLDDPPKPASTTPSSRPPPLPARARSEPPIPPAAPMPMAVPEAPPAPRASLPDVTDVLFEAMHELNFFESAVEGASFCLVTAMRVLPCLAGLVQLFDEKTREFVTVYARGPRAEKLLLKRVPESDPLITRAALSRRAIVMDYGDKGIEPLVADRHAFFGEPWSAAVVPVAHGGRVLAMIELIDPLDGAPFGDVARGALEYIADHYGVFIAERGLERGRVVPPTSLET
jgi:hypothetical protein